MKEKEPTINDAQRVAYLIAGYIRKTITHKEHDELDAWINASDTNMQLFEELTDEVKLEENLKWMDEVQSSASYARLKEQGAFDLQPRRFNYKRMLLVAAVLVVVIAAFVVFKYSATAVREKDITIVATTIEPGGDRATLTIDNGMVIDLTNAATGGVETNDKSVIHKTASGEIVYISKAEIAKPLQHTLTTPTGGQYHVTLPDGTKVWLNASSSLSYPSQFWGNERKVTLRGEAYFEVAKDARKPFRVETPTSEVVVLGTHFNVNAYGDAADNVTTLLEGSVSITNEEIGILLKPGEQVMISKEAYKVTKVDTTVAVAWKNNLFKFKDATIHEIMKQVQRWYAAEVIFKENVSYHFNATVDRSEPIDKLLHYLEATGQVHFSITDKTITVMK